MSIDLDAVEFIGGSEEIKDQSEQAREEARKNFLPYTTRRDFGPPFAKWEDTDTGRTKIYRFLDDDRRTGQTHKNYWLGVLEHKFVAPVPKPKDYPSDRKWPDDPGVNATCRKDKAFAKFFPQGCMICNEKMPRAKTKWDSSGKPSTPAQTVYARAVERQLVRDPDNPKKVIRIEDVMDEYAVPDKNGKDSGDRVFLPRIVVIAKPRSYFFAPLAGAMRDMEDEGADYTCLRGDWRCTQIEFGKDPSFTFKEVTGSDTLPAGEYATEEFPYWDTRNPKVLEYYESTIGWSTKAMVVARAEDEHYERFFVPGGWAKWEKAKEDGKTAQNGQETTKPVAPKAEPKPQRPIQDDDNLGEDQERPAETPGQTIGDAEDVQDSPTASRLESYKRTYQEKLGAGTAPPPRRQPSAIADDEMEQV